jgi:hypothetical protein
MAVSVTATFTHRCLPPLKLDYQRRTGRAVHGLAPALVLTVSVPTKKLVFSELPGPRRLLRALTIDDDNSLVSSTMESDGSSYALGGSVNSG